MTAVANPPTFSQISRPAWGPVDGSSMNPDDARAMFMPRKALSRSNSSSSISSNSSNSSASTVLSNNAASNGSPHSSTTDLSQWSSSSAASRKKPRNQPWPVAPKADGQQHDFSRLPPGRQNGMVAQHGQMQAGPGQGQMAQQGLMGRPMQGATDMSGSQPVLYLLSLNGTFERKTIAVPFAPDTLRIGRQTNQKTIPTAANGFFDSKVLSRQHAEVYAERNGKIFIRDVKSSNGTFVNGSRLSQENRESDPHELSTGDHLELGIDIVSEDQKTVVHHKVAAKVEHAGFMSSSSNVLDMNFGDLDPANSAAMMGGGPMHARGRTGSNASMGGNNRMFPNGVPNNMGQQRPFFLSPVATDQILKKLSNEMRSARLQGQDLGRANQFVGTLLSKNDIKELEKPEAPEPPKPQMHMMNGSLPFRPDPKARFSEPPAPPPQQPLPEKPNVPPLKRGLTERQKQQPGSPAEGLSPIRQENTSQIIQLTDALNSAKRDIDTQTNRMKELESLLREERERREQAEGLAKRLEETSAATTLVNGTADAAATLPKSDVDNDTDSATRDAAVEEPAAAKVDSAAAATEATLQAHIDMMEDQVKGLRSQVEEWKQRAEAAEAERDADRKTLAEMVTQLREEQAQRAAAEAQRQSRSRSRKRSASKSALTQADHPASPSQDDEQADAEKRSVPNHVDGAATAATSTSATAAAAAAGTASDGQDVKAPSWPVPPGSTTTSLSAGHRAVQVQGGMPYASALGVVLLGMGLMAYLNGQGARPE